MPRIKFNGRAVETESFLGEEDVFSVASAYRDLHTCGIVECVILLVAETEVKTVMSPTTVQPVKRLAVTKSFGRRGVSFEVLA